MDKTLISRRFAKAVGTYLDKADVQRYVASRMAELTGRYIPADVQERVLEIGCGTGMFTRMYLKQAAPEEMWLNDLCPEVKPYLADVLGEKVRFVAKDAETLAFPAGQDLIVSCSAVQWFDDLPRFFQGAKGCCTRGATWRSVLSALTTRRRWLRWLRRGCRIRRWRNCGRCWLPVTRWCMPTRNSCACRSLPRWRCCGT